jgi:exonuclease III
MLEIRLFNARSINSTNKINELQCYLSAYKPDILCITETWLHSTTSSSLLIGSTCYSVFRNDRPVDRRGRGVCVIVNNTTVAVIVNFELYHVYTCCRRA